MLCPYFGHNEKKTKKRDSLFFIFPRYGHFSGINRKVQLTYLPHGHPKISSEDEGKIGKVLSCITLITAQYDEFSCMQQLGDASFFFFLM